MTRPRLLDYFVHGLRQEDADRIDSLIAALSQDNRWIAVLSFGVICFGIGMLIGGRR